MKRGDERFRHTYGAAPSMIPIEEEVFVSSKMEVLPALEDLKVEGQRGYLVAAGKIGTPVYVDRELKWSFLPSFLRGQLMVSTACDDRAVQSKQYMTFTSPQDALIFVLFDLSIRNIPAWLFSDGFKRIPRVHAIARVFASQYDAQECHYAVFAKRYAASDQVILGGNWGKSRKNNMYAVFVVPVANAVPGLAQIQSQLDYEKSFGEDEVSHSWADGDSGLTLFHPENDAVAVGVLKCSIFGDTDLKVGVSDPASGSFEIVDKISRAAYQLSYSREPMRGGFRRTQMLKIMHRYAIVNCMDEVLEMRQVNSSAVKRVAPLSSEGWHKSDVALDSAVQFKLGCSMWSHCSVSLADIGTSSLLLPPPSGGAGILSEAPIVLQIEVRLAEPSEDSGVVIVIQRVRADNAAFTISNESDTPIVLLQSGVKLVFQELREYAIVVQPGCKVPFGWIEPEGSSEVLIGVGGAHHESGFRKSGARIDFLKYKESLRLPDGSGKAGFQHELVLEVESLDSGRVLKITRGTTRSPFMSDVINEKLNPFFVRLALSSIALSLVLESPVRREFLSIIAEGFEGQVIFSEKISSYELVLTDLQVDNYSETVVYPVLLYSARKEQAQRRSGSILSAHSNVKADSSPLFQLTLISEASAPSSGRSSPVCIKYFAMRLLELSFQIDSGTLQLLYLDLVKNLAFVSEEETVASRDPSRWMSQINRSLLDPARQVRPIDVYNAKQAAVTSKVYFEELVIHPMKLRLTYVHSSYTRKANGTESVSFTMLDIISSFAEVENMKVRLNSFHVTNALVSRASLQTRLIAKYTLDLQLQLASIAGSLSVIGSPLGFAHKIGGGVEALFYEPYLGAMESPEDFLIGIGIGTSSLITGVVSGALTSGVNIVNSASRGFSYLSADPEYIRGRATRMQQNQASKGGIMEGLVDGSESLIGGISSGVSGLFTKPFQEGSKGGVLGFMSGLGQGLVGMAVKPVLGVTDGISSIAQGISNQVSSAVAINRMRNARAFERAEYNRRHLILTPIDIIAADAQEYIRLEARSNGRLALETTSGMYNNRLSEDYIGYVPLDDSGQILILSNLFLYWRRSNSVSKFLWANISHVVHQWSSSGDTGLKVILYNQNMLRQNFLLIPILSQSRINKAYKMLFNCSYLMGNPLATISLDAAVKGDYEVKVYMEKYCKGISIDGEFEGYKFGSSSVAMSSRRSSIMSESEVLRNAQSRLSAPFIDWEIVDRSILKLLTEWDGSHVGLSASHGSAALIINRSESPINLGTLKLSHGNNFEVFGVLNFKSQSRVIRSQGAALIFAWGHSPSPMESGLVGLSLSSHYFSVNISSDIQYTGAEVSGSYQICFLEKSVSDWWSKYVVVIF